MRTPARFVALAVLISSGSFAIVGVGANDGPQAAASVAPRAAASGAPQDQSYTDLKSQAEKLVA